MQALAQLFRPIWPIVVLLGSGALLAGAHAFQRIGGLAPCPMCLDQREWHWGVVTAAIVGFVLVRSAPKLDRIVAVALGLVLLGAAGMAFYHVAVEQKWIIATCEANVDLGDIQAFDADGTFVAPTCDTPAWTMFGISMAGYNGLISLALALASFVVGLMPGPRDE